MPKKCEGYVYVAAHEYMPSLVKIGVTTREPEVRVKELGSTTGVPGQFSCAYWMYFEDCRAGEARVHKALKNHRIQNGRKTEFFTVSEEQAAKTINKVKAKLEPSADDDMHANWYVCALPQDDGGCYITLVYTDSETDLFWRLDETVDPGEYFIKRLWHCEIDDYAGSFMMSFYQKKGQKYGFDTFWDKADLANLFCRVRYEMQDPKKYGWSEFVRPCSLKKSSDDVGALGHVLRPPQTRWDSLWDGRWENIKLEEWEEISDEDLKEIAEYEAERALETDDLTT